MTAILCVLAVIALIPLLSVAAMSFSSKAADMNIVNLWLMGFTLDSWSYILKDASLWRALGISLGTTILETRLALIVTALMAYPLAKTEFQIFPKA